MICPRCKADYRPGFTRCSDCDVDLVHEHELPKSPIDLRQVGEDGEYLVPGAPGDPNEDPFCSFWKGNDPRLHAEICELLDESGIPHNTVYRRDHLFNLANLSPFEVGVPFSLYERAGKIVRETYEVEDVMDAFIDESKALPARHLHRLPEVLTPSERQDIPGPPVVGNEGWFPEDATVQVWSAGPGDSPNFLVAALHENAIRCRVETNSKVFVLPQDETRAREIVHEIVEGQPPE
jgi:hypothetical protein